MFGPPDFFRGFRRQIFAPHFCGKSAQKNPPGKSTGKNPPKFIQQKNPPTHFCRNGRVLKTPACRGLLQALVDSASVLLKNARVEKRPLNIHTIDTEINQGFPKGGFL